MSRRQGSHLHSMLECRAAGCRFVTLMPDQRQHGLRTRQVEEERLKQMFKLEALGCWPERGRRSTPAIFVCVRHQAKAMWDDWWPSIQNLRNERFVYDGDIVGLWLDCRSKSCPGP